MRVANNLGNLFRAQGNLAEARAEMEVVIRLCEVLVAREPHNAGYISSLAKGHFNFAFVLDAQGKVKECLSHLEQAQVQ